MKSIRQYKISDKPIDGWLVADKFPDGKVLLKIIHVEKAKPDKDCITADEVIAYKRKNYPELID